MIKETTIAANLFASLTDESAFLTYRLCSGNGAVELTSPVFCIDDVPVSFGKPTEFSEARAFFGDVSERSAFCAAANGDSSLRLEIVVRAVRRSPVIRFRFLLHSDRPVRLTKPDGVDALTYFGFDFGRIDQDGEGTSAKEVRFSEFNPLYHSFLLNEEVLGAKDFSAARRVMGPILTVACGTNWSSKYGPTALVAYEHGSQYPDLFLAFDLDPSGDKATLNAVKGNYYHGQVIDADTPFETPWFQLAITDDAEDGLARDYRAWVLQHQSPHRASRKPYIFYNSWNYQERVFHHQKRPYLADMNETRMLAEIEAAHKMGIDVFVLDTGWYEKTGDWRVSTERFPNGLAPIKAKLDEYGMVLGLWFNPTVAALSSEMRTAHEDCLMIRNGKPHPPEMIWETESSQGLSLVSRYWEAFADELIRLHHEVGVTYFKWDAIGQYGSEAAGHFHGTVENSPQERRDCYAFLLGRYMAKVVDKLCTACPEAIVDFDITEGGRTVGLEFLSVGKYFIINNGPYNWDLNMPVPADGNVNLYFFSGPARTWICRQPLTYDKWIPSVLFLTHYLPDDTHRTGPGEHSIVHGENQWLAIASLVLGQNGIWGDLCVISDEGIDRFATALKHYKQVRDEITAASPIRMGMVAGTPEVHEKIHSETGKGAVSFFSAHSGKFTYVTENRVAATWWHNPGVDITLDADGRAVITATFTHGQGAKVIFFGTE